MAAQLKLVQKYPVSYQMEQYQKLIYYYVKVTAEPLKLIKEGINQ